MYYISDYALYFVIPYKLNENNDYCMLGMMIIKKKVLLRMSELQNKFSVFLQEKKPVWGLFLEVQWLGLQASTAEGVPAIRHAEWHGQKIKICFKN